MGYRIWHQSFSVLEDNLPYKDALQERIRGVVRPDTSFTLHGQLPGTYPDQFPGTDIRYGFLYNVHGMQFVAGAMEAERQGYDAVVLATSSSPMIREIRTLVNIPVVGFGDTAFYLSGMYGRKVGMIFFNIERRDFWPEQMRQWGVSERYVGLTEAGVTWNQVVAGMPYADKRKEMVATIIANGEKLAKEQAADVIVPCEMPLNLLLAMENVNYIGGATVIDGIATSFKIAETMIDLKKVSGMAPSKRGFFHDRPDRERVEQVLKFYGLDSLGERFSKLKE